MLVQHTLETVQRNDINQPDAEIEPVAKPTARTRAILLRVHNENGQQSSTHQDPPFPLSLIFQVDME